MTWHLGGALPVGLTLTAGGLLTGTPTTAGTSSATIRVTDGAGCTALITYTITIAAAVGPPTPTPTPPGCPAITLTPATLPDATVGVAYSQTLAGNGGSAPYSFGVTAGTLPVGLTLTSAGVLSGTPTTPGTSTVTIRRTDANGCFAELSFTMSVVTGVPTMPQAFLVLLALGLTGLGYFRLRRRARAN